MNRTENAGRPLSRRVSGRCFEVVRRSMNSIRFECRAVPNSLCRIRYETTGPMLFPFTAAVSTADKYSEGSREIDSSSRIIGWSSRHRLVGEAARQAGGRARGFATGQ